MQDWKIQKPGTACHKTGRKLEEGETFYSAIFVRAEEYERRDYSVEAWHELFPHTDPDGAPPENRPDATSADTKPADDAKAADDTNAPADADEEPFSFWRTRVPKTDEAPRIPFQAAQDFFWKLVESRKKKSDSERILLPLALLLMRKRVLKLVDTKRVRGRDVMHFEEVGEEAERTADVYDPNLEPEDLEAVEEEIRALLFPHLVKPKPAEEEAAAEEAASEAEAAKIEAAAAAAVESGIEAMPEHAAEPTTDSDDASDAASEAEAEPEPEPAADEARR